MLSVGSDRPEAVRADSLLDQRAGQSHRERCEDARRISARPLRVVGDELDRGYAGRLGPPAEPLAKLRRDRTHVAHLAVPLRPRGYPTPGHCRGAQGEEGPDGSSVSPGSGWETCMVRRGSAVRVRKRAPRESPANAGFSASRMASPACRVGPVIAHISHTSFAGLEDDLLGRPPFRAFELVDHVAVGVVGHARRVPRLGGDVEHAAPLGEHQRDERVAQVVRAGADQAGGGRGGSERALAPVAVVVIAPRLAVARGKTSRLSVSLRDAVPKSARSAASGASTRTLRTLRVLVSSTSPRETERSTIRRALEDVAPLEGQRLPRAQAGIGEGGGQGRVGKPTVEPKVEPHGLDGVRRRRRHQSRPALRGLGDQITARRLHVARPGTAPRRAA